MPRFFLHIKFGMRSLVRRTQQVLFFSTLHRKGRILKSNDKGTIINPQEHCFFLINKNNNNHNYSHPFRICSPFNRCACEGYR